MELSESFAKEFEGYKWSVEEAHPLNNYKIKIMLTKNGRTEELYIGQSLIDDLHESQIEWVAYHGFKKLKRRFEESKMLVEGENK